jgi:hypothetical protein
LIVWEINYKITSLKKKMGNRLNPGSLNPCFHSNNNSNDQNQFHSYMCEQYTHIRIYYTFLRLIHMYKYIQILLDFHHIVKWRRLRRRRQWLGPDPCYLFFVTSGARFRVNFNRTRGHPILMNRNSVNRHRHTCICNVYK